MSVLEQYARALATGSTSGAGAELLDAAQDMSQLGEGLVRLRDANQADQFVPLLKVWKKVNRRLLYRAGFRLAGGTQHRVSRDSLQAWAFALCVRCKGVREGCAHCGGLGVQVPLAWEAGESRRVFDASIAGLDARYSDAIRSLYRSARRERDDD